MHALYRTFGRSPEVTEYFLSIRSGDPIKEELASSSSSDHNSEGRDINIMANSRATRRKRREENGMGWAVRWCESGIRKLGHRNRNRRKKRSVKKGRGK